MPRARIFKATGTLLLLSVVAGLGFFAWRILGPPRPLPNPTRFYYGPRGCMAEAQISFRAIWPLKLAAVNQRLKVLVWESGQWVEKPLAVSTEWSDEKGFTLRMLVPTNKWKIDYRTALTHKVRLFGKDFQLITTTNIWLSDELPSRADVERKIPDLKARGATIP